VSGGGADAVVREDWPEKEEEEEESEVDP